MEEKLWDVIVIGGGPAGMMAAGRAAGRGSRVLLIEKNDSLGKKLLITGGGRCNLTNAEFDSRVLLEKFKDDGKFLHSAFAIWHVKDTLNFFHDRGLETKIENEKRVFPLSNKSLSVWETMVEYVQQNNVTILSNSPVIDITIENANYLYKFPIASLHLKNKEILRAKEIIIATGGTSRPETGSTGDAHAWLAKLGHTVIKPEPSLVPLSASDEWIKKLAGVSLSNVTLTPYQNGVKQSVKKNSTKKGSDKILFTHVGISGPSVLNMSKDIGELLKYGEVVISLDVVPHLDEEKLNMSLQTIFKEHDKKMFKNSLVDLLPSTISQIIVNLSLIDPEKNCNSVTREERIRLVSLIKAIPIHVEGLLGLDKAIITSGGVSLSEVDFKTMRSKLYPNMYFVGDILNIDRPSGGYSLQLCWTTGFVAGTSVANE